MPESSATTAVKILKEILAQEVLFPKSERGTLLVINNSVKPSKFNIRRQELLNLMYSFENKGLLQILDDDIILGRFIKQEYDKNGVPLHEVPIEDENEQRVNYEVKDIGGIKNLIETLETELLTPVGGSRQRFGVSKSNQVFKLGEKISKIEIVRDSRKSGRIKVYINGNYFRELDFSRRLYWSKMYDLADGQYTPNDKGFLDYFNSNLQNPFYKKYGYGLTNILKAEDGGIVKNIEKIDLVTRKKITQAQNKTA
jgi:hypothetical protein